MPTHVKSASYDPTAVVFSVANGVVWANWCGVDVSVKLGKHELVSMMMQDFLNQNELGKRLAQKAGER